MQYALEQTVILLDTQLRPAGSAIVKGYQAITNRYDVSYLYPGTALPQLINVPAERLILSPEVWLPDNSREIPVSAMNAYLGSPSSPEQND